MKSYELTEKAFSDFLDAHFNMRGLAALIQMPRYTTMKNEILSVDYTPSWNQLEIHISKALFDALLAEYTHKHGHETVVNAVELRVERSQNIHARMLMDTSHTEHQLKIVLRACYLPALGEVWPVIESPPLSAKEVFSYAKENGFMMKRVPLLGPEEGATPLDGFAVISHSVKGDDMRGWVHFDSLSAAHKHMVEVGNG
jgi:hypothetical protein